MAEGRRTVARKITQPAADSIRDIATGIELGKFDLEHVEDLANRLGVSPGAADLHRRLVLVLRRFADEVEKGVL